MMFQSTCSFHCNLFFPSPLFLFFVHFSLVVLCEGFLFSLLIFKMESYFSLVYSWIHSDLVPLSLPNSGTTEVSHRAQQQNLLARLTSVSLWVLSSWLFLCLHKHLSVNSRGYIRRLAKYRLDISSHFLKRHWVCIKFDRIV